MLTRQEEEQERRETLENDRKLLEAEHRRILREGTTFHQHAQSAANDEAGGRFAAVNPTTVVGAQSLPKHPTLPSSSPWSGAQPEPGIEPALGYPIDAMPESESSTVMSSAVEVPDDPVAAPLGGSLVQQPSGGLVSERAGSSSFPEDQNNG